MAATGDEATAEAVCEQLLAVLRAAARVRELVGPGPHPNVDGRSAHLFAVGLDTLATAFLYSVVRDDPGHLASLMAAVTAWCGSLPDPRFPGAGVTIADSAVGPDRN